MYFQAQIVFKSYVPDGLKKGMWFIRTILEEKELFELDQTFLSPKEEEEFIAFNGYPVKPFIVEEYVDGSIPAILATPDEIGWFDEALLTDNLRDVTIDDLNYIINYEQGFILIDVDGETGEPTLAEGKVIITVDWSVYADPEDYDDYGIICDECGSADVGVNSSDQIICNNCGWEQETKE